MLAALAGRDIARVFRLLQSHGVTQRRIAAMTGQAQSEISEILGGRRVAAYDVLVRIADGLGVPRGYMGLAHDELAAPVADETVMRPVLDSETGRWVVRLPVYLDTYGAALGLCESITAVRPEPAPVMGSKRSADEVTARRWHRAAKRLLDARDVAAFC